MSKTFSTKNIALMAIFVALMAVCSWISLSFGQITFSLQTFAVFVTVGLLGLKRGTISVVVYILLGLAGVPVFAGFTGGIGVIAGYLGGFIVGFLPAAIIIGLIIMLVKVEGEFKKMMVMFIAMLLGDAVCFLIGGIWFKNVLELDWASTFSLSMAPYIVPDIAKMLVAIIVINRVKAYVKLFD